MTAGKSEWLTAADRRSTVEAFARALNREAHNLSQRPDLLWQQLYNRLQWEDEPIPSLLALEVPGRSARGGPPWLRLRTWVRESQSLMRTLTGHTDGVRACAVSPDGAFIVSASDDETLKVWEAATGRERATLTGHTSSVRGCAVSPDGSFIVSASRDHLLKVWDAATGRERTTLTTLPVGFPDWVTGCAVSPDGSFIVSASWDDILKVWDATTRRQRSTLTGHTGPVLGCAISPDGAFIVSASGDNTLKIWDAATGEERATLAGHTDRVTACAVSPDGSFIVSASGDETLKVWDAATGRERVALTGHANAVWVCAVSPDGSFIVSAGWDNTLKIWDTATGRERASLPLAGPCRCVAAHPTRAAATCGDDGGNLYIADFIGVEIGPIVVTAVDQAGELTARCPACFQQSPIETDRLGQEVMCRLTGCDGRMRVNPFVITLAPEGHPSRSRPVQLEEPPNATAATRRWHRAVRRGYYAYQEVATCERCGKSEVFEPIMGEEPSSQCPSCGYDGDGRGS